MLHKNVIEKRIDTCLEYSKEKQPVPGKSFIEFVNYFRNRIAYLENLNKIQAGFINTNAIATQSMQQQGQIPEETMEKLADNPIKPRFFWQK